MKEQAHQKAIDAHAPYLPLLDEGERRIVAKLQQEGTCILSLEELKLSATEQMMAKANYFASRLGVAHATHRLQTCEVGADKKDLGESAEILLWALEPKLLNIVENYIGLPILYQGFAVRRSIADGQYSGVRRWHMDWEDRRTIKIIIYLNDVEAGGGPYQYIRKDASSRAVEALNYYNLGFLSDDEMQKGAPSIDWTACLGKQGSVIITDTSNVFHRAQPPTIRERFSITFCYTSAHPLVVWRSRKVTREQWSLIERQLDARQLNCLTKRKFD
ncbi:MAG: hypothetical protein AAFQ41_15075 [Cyanobacteria bacterium J06623_7]